MKKLFGTDGVRGVANTELTAEMALLLGRVGAYVLTKHSKENEGRAPKVLVGKDPRRSGDMLEAALTAGLCSLGATVYTAGVIPTPAVAFLVRKYKMDAGVMISASHNPMKDNGIKFFNADGNKLPDALEDEIEVLYRHSASSLPLPEGAAVGIVRHSPDAAADYINFLLSTVPELSLAGTTVTLDCANGATGAVAPALFQKLGATVRLLHASPDGVNINADCGSTHMDALVQYMTEQPAGVGFAYDGDGDRVLCVDEDGVTVEGDEVIAICGLDLHERGLLKHSALVGTVMSNMGLALMCQKHGLHLHQTAVGDRYVLEKMLAEDYVLGGEQSGHVIFRRHQTTGDGLLTSLQLLSVMRRTGKRLAELKQVMEVMPQVVRNARVSNDRKRDWTRNAAIAQQVEETEARLQSEGRVLVRPSGTEPLIRVMIEGRDTEEIAGLADALRLLIERELQPVLP